MVILRQVSEPFLSSAFQILLTSRTNKSLFWEGGKGQVRLLLSYSISLKGLLQDTEILISLNP